MTHCPASIIHFRQPDVPPLVQGQLLSYVVFFVTGNPGLVEYYRTFLSHLYALLSASSSPSFRRTKYQVFGRSLSGFELDGDGSRGGRGLPHGLQQQIDVTERELGKLVMTETATSGQPPRVILVGHSVGAYILLEILRRHREMLLGNPKDDVADCMRIVGGICLFPTVTHIAKSKSGRKFSLLLRFSSSPAVLAFLARLLTSWIPSGLLKAVLRAFMSFPTDAAVTTTAFIKSRWGVAQALHMARDEMVTIRSDVWDTEIWGAAHQSPSPHPRPKLRFLFGQNDHWVADETRDDLIRARAFGEDHDGSGGSGIKRTEHWKPRMEVDEEGWPHGFCIKHSVPVAERVKIYIEDIVKSDLDRDL